MVRAYKIKDAVCEKRGREVSSRAAGCGAPLVRLGTIDLRYIVVGGKLYYNLQDFLACFRKNLEGNYEQNMHRVNNIVIKTLVANSGTGNLYALRRGIYCDTSFMAYACEVLHLVDLKQESIFSAYPQRLDDLQTLRDIAARNIPDPAVPDVGVHLSKEEFFQVVPSTLRCSGRGQRTDLVNIPLTATEKDDDGIVKPEEEQQEPIATPDVEKSHPVDKDIIKAVTSLDSGVKVKFAKDIMDAVDSTSSNVASTFTKSIHGVEEEVKSVVEALIKGKKLSINVTVAIE